MAQQASGPPGGPPWGDRAVWDEVNRSIAWLVSRHAVAMAPLMETARAVRRRLVWTAALLEDLCRRTCMHCPEPCCLGARIWFDTADLLVLHLAGLTVPEAQPISSRDAVCRYWSPRGCRLERLSRPWICTWYLCPPQTAILRGGDGAAYAEVSRIFAEIKSLRRSLEEGFVRVTSGTKRPPGTAAEAGSQAA